MKVPCHNCPDRELGCHGKCEKYQAYAEWRQQVYEERIVKEASRPDRKYIERCIKDRQRRNRSGLP